MEASKLYDLAHELFEYKDGDLIRRVQRRSAKVGSSALYCGGRYMRVRLCGKQEQAHRVIFLMHHGYMPSIVDHKDGNVFNNCIENLREATQQQNCFNRQLRSDNKCKTPNVHWHKQHEKFAVVVSVDGKQKHFGYYDDLQSASVVAEQARQEHFGNFAYKGI
jgi:hypothetical protein